MSLVIPISLAVGKYLIVKGYAKSEIEKKKSEGVHLIKREIIKTADNMFKRLILNVLINILFILIAIYIFPFIFTKNATILAICSVYLSSIIYSNLRLVSLIKEVWGFFVKHKLNAKEYLKGKAYDKTFLMSQKELASLPWYKKVANKMWGNSLEHYAQELSERGAKLALKEFKKIIGQMAFLGVIYFVLFKLFVSPVLVSSSTNLSWWESLLYPLLYSIDFFIGTSFLQYIIH